MALPFSASTPTLMSKSSRPGPSRSKTSSLQPIVTMTSSNDVQHLPSSRSTSLLGKKRPRESDGDVKTTFRRTKSVDTNVFIKNRSDKDRDRAAFQKSLIAVFVPNALKESLTGTMSNYNDLVSHFQLPSASSSTTSHPLPPMLPLLRGLSAHVNLLTPDVHGALVSAILSLPWATGDEKFVKAFIGFSGVLVSSQPAWAKEVANMAVKGLAWQPVMTPAGPGPMTRRLFHARYHLLLSHLLSLMPTLPTVLQPLLVRHFPHRREPEVAQTTWVRNSCELIGYCPEVGQRVWGEIVDRMLRIDLEITNILDEVDDDDDDDDDDNEEDDLNGDENAVNSMSFSTSLDPFDLPISQDVHRPEDEIRDDSDDESEVDIEDMSSVDGDNSEEDEKAINEAKIQADREKRRAAVKSMRLKLDGMLFYFFEHLLESMGSGHGTTAAEMAAKNLESKISSSGMSTPTTENPNPLASALATRRASPTPGQSLAHFQTLLTLFTRQILPTSSTQHIPFLLFITSSLSLSHTELFLGLLVSQALYATSTSRPTAGAQAVPMTLRIASAVYIGSVVCRARFVSDEQARQVMTYLLAYIDGKMHQTKPDELQLFYAVCQAAMLIFCFRWRAFQKDAVETDVAIVGELEIEGESLEGDGKWMADLDILQRVITSDLNPLLGCNSTIVSTFAQVAHQTNFAYCFSIMEANQQSSSRQVPSSSSLNNMAKPGHPSRQSSMSSSISSIHQAKSARQANIEAGLDSYFPFDPFTLPRSKRFIEHLYRTWSEVAIDADESDDDDDDDDDDVKNALTSEADSESALGTLPSSVDMVGTSMSFGASLPKSKRKGMFDRDYGLSSSLEGMSISPNIRRR
ncbi:RNA polymerase I-specific transcription initiation factor RRN3 [Kockovaella imperatae]|uniref:RNA polymerase I-specific transcription initiation factor RRN3 n=1 Tax=Kockovaella imperatae TaxID=4999 RepID=A0A1Y1UIG3_9TREE|nr:RNA polymerase I-specific transcription initiation factor RRN3 [Kockovaella imperatae]ORX37286.1 RNA polymerase I-specific transcription initiation factor RRN3 [Kockovaella imperatae]